MPTSIKRKKTGASGSASSSKINAAPFLGSGSGPGAESEDPVTAGPVRPDLLSTLRDQFGPAPAPAGGGSAANRNVGNKSEAAKKKDDYEKFVEEMGDMLGPTS